VNRRNILQMSAALVGLGLLDSARAEPASELVAHDLLLDGDKKLARRCLLLVPRGMAPGERLPLLILCHGLGETKDELLGIHAWSGPYGLVKAYDRLKAPPIRRAPREAKYLTDERIQQLNNELTARPLRGLAIACPFTPNPHKLLPTAVTLDRYATWLQDSLMPAVRAKVTLAQGPASTGIGGVSLGGFVALEMFCRKPELFGTVSTVQGAFNQAFAHKFAERLARAAASAGPRRAHVLTSSADPYRPANEALAAALSERNLDTTLLVTPGPHSQGWLRESGSLEVLAWHDRALRAQQSSGGRRSGSP